MVAAASWSTISQMWVAHHVVAVVPLLPLRAEDVATRGRDLEADVEGGFELLDERLLLTADV